MQPRTRPDFYVLSSGCGFVSSYGILSVQGVRLRAGYYCRRPGKNITTRSVMQAFTASQQGCRLGRRVDRSLGKSHCARAVLEEGKTMQERRKRRDNAALPSGHLRLFLDSANIASWDLLHNTGCFYGITTNPTILERDRVKCDMQSLTNLAQAAFELGCQELHLQSWGSNVQRLSSVAFDLAGIDPKRVVVKLPCTLEGIQAAALLRESNIRVTITGLYTSSQVLLASSVGAEYAAPYLGRMNDLYRGNQGTAAVIEMQKIIHAHHSKMRLLVASVREPAEMAHLSAQGCDTFTISPAVASKMFLVQGTLDAAADFEAAAQRNGAYDCDSSRLGVCQ